MKNSVYILPESVDSLEAFQWLSQQIQEIGGEVIIVRTNSIENIEEAEIVGLFNEERTRTIS